MSLLFLSTGAAVPTTHQVTLSAGYAFCCSAATGCGMGTAFLWAIAVGTLACLLAYFLADTFMVHGGTWIDPPAFTHLCVSIAIFSLSVSVIGSMIPAIILLILALFLTALYWPKKIVGAAISS